MRVSSNVVMPNTTFLPIKTALAVGTRLDTRPIPVADGWAGAEIRVFTLSNSITMTNGPTDGRTKPLIELRVHN